MNKNFVEEPKKIVNICYPRKGGFNFNINYIYTAFF